MTTLTKSYDAFTLATEFTYRPGTPDQTSGPPEACSLGDDEELEIESITLQTANASIDLQAIGFMDELGESMNEKIGEWCREEWERQAKEALESRLESIAEDRAAARREF